MAENNIPIQIEVRPPSRSDVDGVVRTFAEIKQRVEAQGRDIGKGQKYAVFNKSDLDVGLNNFKQYANSIVSIQRQMERDLAKQDIFKAAGIRSPQAIQNELNYLNQAKQLWMEAGKSTEGYRGALEQIDRRINVLTTGNARARGELHRFTAALASLSFELTGAIYGLTALGSILGGPAILGVNFLKTIEDARLGMTGILISMGKINGEAIKLPQALSIAGQVTDSLAASSLKYAVSLEDLINTFRSILAPGLAAGMNLRQIEQISTVGTVAVKSIGLESRQVVQEIRDLVAGGIQAASSTLATSLGVTDKDIKAIKNSGGDLFDFLMTKLEGFRIAASERANTLSGAFELLKIKVVRLFADEEGFQGLKNALNAISNYIGTIDESTGKIQFNENLLRQVESYWNGLKLIGDVLGKILQALGFVAEHLDKIAAIVVPWFVGSRLLPILAEWISGIGKLATGALLLHSNFQKDAEIIGKTNALMFSLGATGEGLFKKFASLSTAARGGLLGLALWGTYELADYLGVIDNLFSNMYKRMDEFNRSVKSASKEQLESQLVSLSQREQQILSAQRQGDRSFSGRDISGVLTETQNQLTTLRTQLSRLTDSSQVQSAVAVGQSVKRIQDILKEGRDPTVLRKEYEAQIELIKKDTQVRLENAKTSEDQVLIRKEESRALSIARKQFEDSIRDKKGERRLQIEENTIEKITQKQKNLTDETVKYTQSIATSIELRDFELSLAGKRTDEIEILKDSRKEQEQLNEVLKKYQDLLISIANSEAITQQQKSQLFSRTIKNYQDESEAIKTSHEKNQESIKKTFDTQNSAAFGAKEAWNEYANGGITAAEQIKNAFTKVFQATEDALVEFVKTGKISFGSLVDSMLNDLIRMAAHQATKSFFDIIGTSLGGSGGSGGFFGSIGSSIMSLFSANGNAFDSAGHISKFANGGAFTNSIVSQPTMFAFANGGAFGMMGEAGPEAILPLTRTPGGDLGVRSTGTGAVQVNVSVNMETGATSTTTQGGQDMSQLGDIIGNKVKSVILEEQRPGGLLNRSR